MVMKYTSSSVEQTWKIAQQIAQTYPPGTVFGLFGDLGSGKTTFVQGFCQSLGVSSPVLSPTFVINRIYPIPGHTGQVFHFDLYRLNNPSEELGIRDLLETQQDYILIEWPEKIAQILPNMVKIYFQKLDDNLRQIEIAED